MKYNKVIFIVNAFHQPRVKKRIQEFISKGYSVEVYGFDRDTKTDTSDWEVETHCLGQLPSTMSYYKRVGIIYKAIRKLLKKVNDSNVLFYLFQLDIAWLFTLQCSRDYIFEESDLVHTQINQPLVRYILERFDKKIIKHSLFTVFTSEGFPQYHFGRTSDPKWVIINNKLDPKVEKISEMPHKQQDDNQWSIGFVGFPRFKSVVKFAEVVSKYYPTIQFHFFGKIVKANESLFESLQQSQNCHFHGEFINPQDLPRIYSNIDLVLSTYGDDSISTRYAEPNKLYEAIYFETPIIVSEGTYLAEKVKRLGIGYVIKSDTEQYIRSFLDNLSPASISKKVDACRSIPKLSCISSSEPIFSLLENK